MLSRIGPRRFTSLRIAAGRTNTVLSPGRRSSIGHGGDRMEYELSRVLPGDVHERQAARLRELASTATTGPVKARLLREAEQHDRLARGEPALVVTEN